MAMTTMVTDTTGELRGRHPALLRVEADGRVWGFIQAVNKPSADRWWEGEPGAQYYVTVVREPLEELPGMLEEPARVMVVNAATASDGAYVWLLVTSDLSA